jgi:hypothetical protein
MSIVSVRKAGGWVIIFFALACVLYGSVGCAATKSTLIPAEEEYSSEGADTLLEQRYADLDADGETESIELYTSAAITNDGKLGWDTGDQWALLVRKGERIYPLFCERLQYGEVQFWVAGRNAKDVEGPTDINLEKYIYVTVTTNCDVRIFSFTWDSRSAAYKRETVFDPDHQWVITHTNRYDFADALYFETPFEKR